MEETFAFPSMVDKDRLLVYCQPKAFATPKVVKEAPQPAPPPPPPKDSAPALAPVKSGDKTSSKKRKAESGPDGPAKKPQVRIVMSAEMNSKILTSHPSFYSGWLNTRRFMKMIPS